MEIALRTTEDEVVRGAEAVEALCDEAGFPSDRRDEVRTAIVEALSNAVIHGNRRRDDAPILLRAAVSSASLFVEVHDAGDGLRRLPPEPDLERKLAGDEDPGGWGVHLMRRLASDVEFVIHAGGGHSVKLRFETHAPERPVAAVIRRSRDD